MSSAVADTPAPDAAPKKPFGKKKLIMMLVVALVVLGVGGGAALYFIKKRQAKLAEEAGEGEAPAAAQAQGGHGLQKRDLKHPPAYVPLEMFTVNLADKDADRYAQIGVTMEMEDAHAADEVKGYMPAIRSNILLVLSRKTAADLLAPEGKKQLAYEIKREALRALGIAYEEESPAEAASAAKGPAAKAKKKKKPPEEPLPIRDVFFSNFIIQ